jgi:hypothetical protein
MQQDISFIRSQIQVVPDAATHSEHDTLTRRVILPRSIEISRVD